MKAEQLNIYNYDKAKTSYVSQLPYVGNLELSKLFEFYDELNLSTDHKRSNDDICTPMNCVKKMVDYLPNELWNRKNVKVLEPCAGNGNFGAYISKITDISNIWFNELNEVRYRNCLRLLKPINYTNDDFFKLPDKWNQKYDLIVANPPYSGGGNKNTSISNRFIEKSISMLKDKGYLCFITPNNWMTYNNNNTTFWKLLNEGSFLVIDNDCKKYFKGVGSSFTIIIWQKNVFDHKTRIINNYVIKDVQEDVVIPKDLKFMPLYISNDSISITKKFVRERNQKFFYRCDLHNFTQKDKLADKRDSVFKYKTIHTARKIRYSKIKQDIYDKWIIVVPLSTYFKPFIEHNVNVTQSVGYIAFETKSQAEKYLKKIINPLFKTIIHLTRYGNFNNIMVLKHLDFEKAINLNDKEKMLVEHFMNKLNY